MTRSNNSKAFGGTIGVGTLFAFLLSWFEHHSLMWAIMHAVYSWFYVAYYGLTKSRAIAPIETSPAMTAAAVVLAAVVGVAAIAVVLFRRL